MTSDDLNCLIVNSLDPELAQQNAMTDGKAGRFFEEKKSANNKNACKITKDVKSCKDAK